MEIQVFRMGLAVTKLSLLAGTFTKSLMAEHELLFSVKTNETIDIHVGDYLTYKGEQMTINREPEVKRDHLLEYSITFQGQRHTLSRFLLKDEGALTFDYSDSLENYLFMFLESINSVDSGWTVGELDEVEPFTLTFEKVDHLTALNMIAEACKCEWQLKNKAIYIKKSVGQFRDYPLSYGKDNGLYSIKRTMLENSKIVTRAYAVGGTNNLPAGYPFKQLTLSGFIEDETAMELFGPGEGVFEDLEIYPRLKNATVIQSEKLSDNVYSIKTDLDFDLNGQFIVGQDPSIVFKSGMLNDQKFKILSYNNTTKTIRYEAIKTANGDLLPSGASIAEVGDKYVLLGIRMPQSYVDAALQELTEKRLEYLNSNKVPRVVYEAPLDPLDLKRNNVVIDEGDILPFRDSKIGLDENMRITKVSYPACFPEQLLQGMVFTAEIGKEVTYTRTQKVEKDIKETKEVVTQYSKQSWENDRRNVLAMNEFKSKVFDPDGNLQNPLIQAIVALIGTDSMFFDLDGLTMSENAGNDPNSFALSACRLIHRVYKIESLGYIWELPSFSTSSLEPTKPYYLAAKCSKTTLSGEWVLTTDQKKLDDEIGYWFFNLGILSSVLEGKRSFQLTKLFTLISGGNVITDTITAYMIDVKKLFAQYIEAENFWLKQGKIGIFDVKNGHIQTESWEDSSNNNGVRFTNNGILSRNANEKLFPASTGIDYAGSLVGMVDQDLLAEQDSFGGYARAGLMGINYKDMDVQAMNQLMWSWGQYGVLASSLKVMGGVEFPARIEEGTGTVQINRGDFNVIIGGQHTAAQLPEKPNNGQLLIIKNSRAIDITVTAGTGHNFIFANNSQANQTIISGGKYRWYQFVRQLLTGGYWVEIGAID